MKHAYLIMAHNEPYILEKLLKLIDDERNDIYLHIDKKWKEFDFEKFKKFVIKGHLYFTDRLDVKWGSFSQIECELLLMKTASKNDRYAYYHLISGIDLPLTTQDVMHKFYDSMQGTEFISFDNHKMAYQDTLNRIKYYYAFTEYKHSRNIFAKVVWEFLNRLSLGIQKLFRVNRLKKVDYEIRKGANWISVTDDCVRYILSKNDEIYKMYSHSICADELFVQTIVYNSKFYKRVISKDNDDFLYIKRHIDWNRGKPYTFKVEDFGEIINSNCFFARKFSTKVDKKIIDMIYDYVKNQN